MTEVDDAGLMGDPAEAKTALLEKARAWRELRQPSIDSAAGHRATEKNEHQVRFELANAALLWLWHEENPATPSPSQDAGSVVRALELARDYIDPDRDPPRIKNRELVKLIEAALAFPRPVAGREAKSYLDELREATARPVSPWPVTERVDALGQTEREVYAPVATPLVSEASLSFVCPKCGTRGITDGNASTVTSVSEASREALSTLIAELKDQGLIVSRAALASIEKALSASDKIGGAT